MIKKKAAKALKEPMFEVKFDCPASRLGFVLAEMANYANLSSTLIVERDNAKNMPKGTLKEIVLTVLKAHPKALDSGAVYQALLSAGFTKNTIVTSLRRLVKMKVIRASGGRGAMKFSLPKEK